MGCCSSKIQLSYIPRKVEKQPLPHASQGPQNEIGKTNSENQYLQGDTYTVPVLADQKKPKAQQNVQVSSDPQEKKAENANHIIPSEDEHIDLKKISKNPQTAAQTNQASNQQPIDPQMASKIVLSAQLNKKKNDDRSIEPKNKSQISKKSSSIKNAQQSSIFQEQSKEKYNKEGPSFANKGPQSQIKNQTDPEPMSQISQARHLRKTNQITHFRATITEQKGPQIKEREPQVSAIPQQVKESLIKIQIDQNHQPNRHSVSSSERASELNYPRPQSEESRNRESNHAREMMVQRGPSENSKSGIKQQQNMSQDSQIKPEVQTLNKSERNEQKKSSFLRKEKGTQSSIATYNASAVKIQTRQPQKKEPNQNLSIIQQSPINSPSSSIYK